MKPPDTVYSGVRGVGTKGQVLGTRVFVREPGRLPYQLTPAASRKVRDHSPTGFEWGYGGSGPAQLALALALDATGDPQTAAAFYQWFKWAEVANWVGDRWWITAGRIAEWVEQWRREEAPKARACSVCGCTDDDCAQCVAATGEPCSWVAGHPDLCSRCYAEMGTAVKGGG